MIKKIMASILALALLVSGWPTTVEVSAADDGYVDVYIPGYGKIINGSDMPEWDDNFRYSTESNPLLDEANSFGMFIARVPGTSINGVGLTNRDSYSVSATGFSSVGDATSNVRIRINEIPALKNLIKGGNARFLYEGRVTKGSTTNGVGVRREGMGNFDMFSSGSTTAGGIKTYNSGWVEIGPTTEEIMVGMNLYDSANFIGRLYFADIDAPTYESITLTTDGTVRFNDDPAVQKDELFLKRDSMINLAVSFNQPVSPTTPEQASDLIDGKNSFLRTALHTNPGGDGFSPSTYYLTSADSGLGSFTSGGLSLTSNFRSTYNMKYTAADYDDSGNAPLDPARLGGESDEALPTLMQRINAAGFVDGAGNPLAPVTDLGDLPLANNAYPDGENRVLIDARSPRYSTVKNGVQPDILSGLTLNKGDQIRFTVNLNEAAISAKTPLEDTRLVFANGMTAAYESGANSDRWTFVATVPEGGEVETALLETAALEHADDPGNGKALKDYSDNVLVEPVPSIAESKLAIDKTPPVIQFEYQNNDNEAVQAGQYVQGGQFIVRASDPDLGGEPSKGLFRPSGDTGLVYYAISQSPDDPFVGKADDHYAAIKRYSLALKQPSEDLYDSAFDDVVLGVAENGVPIPLPKEAEGGNGSWYMHTWSADMSWDSARQLMQYDKGAAQRDAYLAQHPEATPMELETYFRTAILPGLGDYANLDQWPLSDFTQDDSNWSYGVAELKLDNDKPVVKGSDVVDNLTDKVFVTLTATDSTSWIKDSKVFYQFVKSGDELREDFWQQSEALDQDDQVTISTEGAPAIDRGGQYELYAKAIDIAGNEAIVNLSEGAADAQTGQVGLLDVLVIFTDFEGETGEYVINDGLGFTIAGVPIDTIEYQYGTSSVRPEVDSDWIAFDPEDTEEETLNEEAGARYLFPTDRMMNGTRYAHIKVKQQDMDRYYYYFGEYKFDHLPPAVTFGSQGYLYPMTEQSVQITVADTLVDFLGVAPQHIRYQWVKVTEGEEEIAPDADSPLWQQAPTSREITLTTVSKADDGNYRLHVHAQDSLGNDKLYDTEGLFAVYHLSEEPPVGSAGLIKVESNSAGKYEAILKLEVDVPSQVGYLYSISANDGANWSTWRPFTNYVGVPVNTNDAGALADRIKVKFKGSYGTNISEIYAPTVNIQDAPAYALAWLERNEPVRGGAKRGSGGFNDGLEIAFDAASGKTITPTAANPEMPETVAANQRFRVYRNGTYSFNVADGDKSAVAFIVVSNFDDKEPVVKLKYATLAQTNGSVRVSLEADEPIRITNLDTSFRTFRENGDFTFEYEDAVGLGGTAVASVGNIDKTPPEADIALHYNNSEVRALILHGGARVVVNSEGYGYDAQGARQFYAIPTVGNVLATNRIVAELQPKAGADQDYQIVANSAGKKSASIVVTSGDQASFTIVDAAGNTSVVKTPKLSMLVTSVPKVKRTIMQRVDEVGNEVPAGDIVMIDGKPYSKGKMRVSLELVNAPVIANNEVMIGNMTISEFSRDYGGNEQATLALTDRIGNRLLHAFAIEGLDNEAPVLKLNEPSAAIALNKPNFDIAVDLGGYTAMDNVSAAEDITVEAVERVLVAGQYETVPFEPSKPGKHLVQVIARDQVGNETIVMQQVYVQSAAGMFVTANGLPLSGTTADTAIVDRTTVTFAVQNYNVIQTNNGNGKETNELGTFDILYAPGLVREGQMKYIATKITYEELMAGSFTVTLPKVGWYTIIVRNQEREQVIATLLVSRNR